MLSKLIMNILTKLCEFHNYYPSSEDKIEIEKETLSQYQLMIADFYNFHINNVKQLVPNFFLKRTVCVNGIIETYNFT